MTHKEMQKQRLERRLEQYLLAEEKILLNQSYQIGDRTFTRADLDTVYNAIKSLTARIEELENDGGRNSRVKHAEFIY